MKSLHISSLYSGGLITNYYCTSQCRHCLYGCSPRWPKEYITKEKAKSNFELIKSLGCYSVHIGGGEPLNEDEYPIITMLYNSGIKALLETAMAKFGFNPGKEYFNKCHLCFDIRKYMVKEKGIVSKELQPVEYYDNV